MAHYKRAKHASYQTLNQCYITSLPVNLHQIVDSIHYIVHSYQQGGITQLLYRREIEKDGDGFIVKINDEKHIYINEKKQPIERRKHTLAHEIGHGILNHPVDNIPLNNLIKNDKNHIYEYEANTFAANLLAPICVLKALNIYTSDKITQICNIPKTLADAKAQKIRKLKNTDFQTCPLEQELLKNFECFIKKNQSKF